MVKRYPDSGKKRLPHDIVCLGRSHMIFSSNFKQEILLDIWELIKMRCLFEGGVYVWSVLSAATFKRGLSEGAV